MIRIRKRLLLLWCRAGGRRRFHRERHAFLGVWGVSVFCGDPEGGARPLLGLAVGTHLGFRRLRGGHVGFADIGVNGRQGGAERWGEFGGCDWCCWYYWLSVMVVENRIGWFL